MSPNNRKKTLVTIFRNIFLWLVVCKLHEINVSLPTSNTKYNTIGIFSNSIIDHEAVYGEGAPYRGFL